MGENIDPALPRKEIVVEVFEGADAPRVQLNEGDRIGIAIRNRGQSDPIDQPEGPEADEEVLSISLDSVDIEVDNQSFGMITASTGCASNKGGPSC
ncbi:hypothetical protein ACFTUC_37135 [Streptomyces sp. NPDC056944]|uniref:hypothetical protein n=1 Tax=Streptomyces sp. NPDC056944 TaxID=3345972 RepID=UPI00363B780C